VSGPETVFYDGACGLCHRSVRFVLLRDRRAQFVFAPIGGETFRAAFRDEEAASLPSSLVIRTRDGRTLSRSDATIHLLRAVGGGWGLVGALLRAVPRPLRDLGYRAVARARRRLFAAPASGCPAVPPELRVRLRP
jgi:predicted DCC family thiol-disulfide oxidoreductase YuxK